MAKVLVRYVARGKDQVEEAVVAVDAYRPGRFTATHLGLWGCGKEGATVEAAVRLLVQDMASIRSIDPVA